MRHNTSGVSHKCLDLCCVQNGPPARRVEGASPLRAVTETQRRRWPIFNATRRAVALFRFFRVAHSGKIAADIAARSRLEKSKNSRQQRSSHLWDTPLALLRGFLAPVLFHHCARGNLCRPFSIASRLLGAFLDMLVLALLLVACPPQMFLGHNDRNEVQAGSGLTQCLQNQNQKHYRLRKRERRRVLA